MPDCSFQIVITSECQPYRTAYKIVFPDRLDKSLRAVSSKSPSVHTYPIYFILFSPENLHHFNQKKYNSAHFKKYICVIKIWKPDKNEIRHISSGNSTAFLTSSTHSALLTNSSSCCILCFHYPIFEISTISFFSYFSPS